MIATRSVAAGLACVLGVNLSGDVPPAPARLTPPTEFHVIASGQISCLDNGVLRPLANARVEIMDSDNDIGTFGDDLMGVTSTNAAGYFSSDGVGGDGGNWSWSRPDVYARIMLDDQWVVPVRMKDEMGTTRSWATPQHDHDNVEGNVDLGAWWWGSQASPETHNASAPCVWLDAREAVLAFAGQMHTPPPEESYEIQYWSGIYPTGDITPFTTLATTYWPRHYSTFGGLVTTHEFYHAVRHGYDGDQAHWDWDDVRFLYGRSHGYCDSKHLATHDQATREGYAFNEGWSDFAEYAGFVNVPTCIDSLDDMTLEGDVAVRLIRLERRLDTLMTGAGLAETPRHRMLAILRDNPGTIHSYDEFCRAVDAGLPGSCTGLVIPHSATIPSRAPP